MSGHKHLWCLCLFALSQFILGQEVNNLDYYKNRLISAETKTEKMTILYEIVNIDGLNPEKKLEYSNTLIDFSSEDSIYKNLTQGFLQKGNSYQLIGDFDKALEAYLVCLKLSEKDNDLDLSSALPISIADTYSMIGNSKNAKYYYSQGIELLRKNKDSMNLSRALLNSGDEYFNSGDYKKALELFSESERICENLNYSMGKAYNLGNIGMVYAEQGQDKLAEKNINEAIRTLEASEDFYPISIYLTYMSDIYLKKNDLNTAFLYSQQSLELAKKYNLKNQVSEASLQLSELSKKKGDFKSAYEYYQNHDKIQDSIINIETVQQLADFRTDMEVGKKQAEVNLSEQKRKNQRIVIWSTVGLTFLIGLLAYGLFRRNRFVQKTNKIIAKEKERSDNLLLNILPEETAEELKEKGRVAAKKYNAVTVLFSDFKGFTSYAENLSPEELVQTIDYYFTEFDGIMDKYGLEKIKTIGDAYMAVGGLSLDSTNQANDMLLAAKEMNEFVAKAKNDKHTTATFDIRIGINTGPVVAGVVGTKKFAYDIWGDTVNIASRMESSSEPGRINISEDTYNIVKNDFKCDYRGELAVKNRGSLKMYFVNC